jgi:hypothetical protein
VALQQADIGCAISEAYLHAIAHYAGYPCQGSTRLIDNTGVDVSLSVNEDFGPHSVKDFDAKIQLKHTSSPTFLKGGKTISHEIDVPVYNRFRETNTGNCYLLILLVLGPKSKDWLTCTPKQLCIKGVAYYASLHGRDAPSGGKTATVHYETRKRFTVESLKQVLRTFAAGEAGKI